MLREVEGLSEHSVLVHLDTNINEIAEQFPHSSYAFIEKDDLGRIAISLLNKEGHGYIRIAISLRRLLYSLADIVES